MIIDPINLPKAKRPWSARKILISTASFFFTALTITLLAGCSKEPPKATPAPSFTPKPNGAPPQPKKSCDPEQQKVMKDGTVYCSVGERG